MDGKVSKHLFWHTLTNNIHTHTNTAEIEQNSEKNIELRNKNSKVWLLKTPTSEWHNSRKVEKKNIYVGANREIARKKHSLPAFILQSCEKVLLNTLWQAARNISLRRKYE